jgi:cob(I)alamin adenosyltransferase
MMWFYTGKGDEGEANLFDGFRLPKSAPVFDLIGALDEATAHLGLAISFSGSDQLKLDLAQIQDDLSKLMGLIAGVSPAALGDRFNVDQKLEWIESRIRFYGESLDNPHAFVYAGKTHCGAAIDIARTVVRKAERIFTQLFGEDDSKLGNLPYLNRLSSFLFILRLFVDNQPESTK